MEINTKKFAQAAAQTAGIVWIVCAIVVALFPAGSLKLLGWLTHANPDALPVRTMTLTGFVLGLIQFVIYSYIIAWVFAKLYNKSLGSK